MFKIIAIIFIGLGSLAGDPILKTGQTIEYMSGDDGTYHSVTGRDHSYSRDDIYGIVDDNTTRLQWQDYYTENRVYRANWNEAIKYCSELNLNGNNWRLPSRAELRTIVDYSKADPAIDTNLFQNTIAALYWSATTYAGNQNVAWRLSFNDGGDYIHPKSSIQYVRCVRSQK